MRGRGVAGRFAYICVVFEVDEKKHLAIADESWLVPRSLTQGRLPSTLKRESTRLQSRNVDSSVPFSDPANDNLSVITTLQSRPKITVLNKAETTSKI